MEGNLPRTISNSNFQATQKCQEYLIRDWKQDPPKGGTNYFQTMPDQSFSLPALPTHKQQFKDFVYSKLIDKTMKEELEECKAINWCKETTSLVPLSTLGDGNCLLHAASLGMWGVHDRQGILKKAVYDAVTHYGTSTSLYSRWKKWRREEMTITGIRDDEYPWDNEWMDVQRNVSNKPSSRSNTLGGTDQFHVFVLSNVLRRPIIMYAVPKLRSFSSGHTLQRVHFTGLYLPLLWDSCYCKKDPLLLGYSNSHYSPLVVIDTVDQYKGGFLVLPLVYHDLSEIPIKFLLGGEVTDALKRSYLNLTNVPGNSTHGQSSILCARLTLNERAPYLKPLMTSFVDRCYEVYRVTPPQPKPRTNIQQKQANVPRMECRDPSCDMFGDPMFNGYCSKCHKKRQQDEASPSPRHSSIKCSICHRKQGLPEHLGMCRDCHEQQQSGLSHAQTAYQQPSSSPSPRSSRSHTTNHSSLAAQECRAPGCEFFGKPETDLYCSKCYNERRKVLQEQQGQELVMSQHRAPSQQQGLGGVEQYRGVQEDAPKCTQCHEFYGAEHFGGLCNKCFMDKTKQEAATPPSQPHKEHKLARRNTLNNVSGEVGHLRNDLPPFRSSHSSHALEFGHSEPSPLKPHLPVPESRDAGAYNDGDTKRWCFSCNDMLPIDPVRTAVCGKCALMIRNLLSIARNTGNRALPVQSGYPPAQAGRQQVHFSQNQNSGPPNIPGGYQMGVASGVAGAMVGRRIETVGGGGGRGGGVGEGVAGASGEAADGGDGAVGQTREPVKLLCRTVGCAFYAVPELDNYCRNCTEERQRVYTPEDHERANPPFHHRR